MDSSRIIEKINPSRLIVKDDFFLKVQCLYFKGEVDKFIVFSCEIFPGFHVPKIVEIASLSTEIFKHPGTWRILFDLSYIVVSHGFAVCGIQDVGSEMTFKPSSSSTCKFTDFARLYSTPFQAGQRSDMLPVGESVSVIEPCHDLAAAADTPAISQPNHFEVTKSVQRPRLSSAYYDLGTGISKIKYCCGLCL